LNPNDIPSGWEGGLRTQDVYGSGTIGTGIGGTLTLISIVQANICFWEHYWFNIRFYWKSYSWGICSG
jgi:hypothetical protein